MDNAPLQDLLSSCLRGINYTVLFWDSPLSSSSGCPIDFVMEFIWLPGGVIMEMFVSQTLIIVWDAPLTLVQRRL